MSDNFLRCSQLVGSFGPGALIDFPDRSVIIGGLSAWDRQGGTEVQEPRLIAKLRQALGVGNLQLFTPPAYDEAPGAPRFGVAARIFPTWFVTQERAANPGPFGRRRLIGIDGTEKNGLIYRDPDDSRRKPLTPIRFVCACRKGHTDDLDWRTFVHRGKTDCRRTLWIEERGTSGEVTDTWIGCDCGQQRQLYEALDLKTFPLGYCNGKRPWLGYFQGEECKEPNRLLVRSASNAYFAELMSVISLPDKNEAVATRLNEIWDLIKDVDAIADLELLRKLQAPVRAALEGIPTGEVLELIRQRRAGGVDERPVKEAEFDILASGQNVIGRDAPDSTFFAETLDRPKWDPQSDRLLAPVERLVLIHRLREVVAQVMPLPDHSVGDLTQAATALADGRLAAPVSSISLARLGVSYPQGLARELDRLAQLGLQAKQMSVVLQAVIEERRASWSREVELELVVTGPDVREQARDTAVVVEQLFEEAKATVLLVGFALYDGNVIFRRLAQRLDATPELQATLCLDISRRGTDTTKDTDLITRYEHKFRQRHWSGKRLPHIYFDPRGLTMDSTKRAVLHAKCIVIDGKAALVTSANPTPAAYTKNIEVGVVVRGGDIPRQITGHFSSLIRDGILRRLEFAG